MFSIHDRPSRLCDGINRREMIRVGGLSALGLSLPMLLQQRARANVVSGADAPTFGRAKNVIFLWLQGGPPQHETFDPKPEAPLEIRGSFKPISTNVPGIQISELLPRTAAMTDKLAIVRSLATDDNNHDVSAYWLLTGYKYPGGTARAIKPNDWPYFGSLVKMLKPSTTMPPFTSIWLPDMMRLNDNVTPAGQTAGFLGKQWEPERIVCDPSTDNFKIDSFALPQDVPAMRFSRRESLLQQVEQHFGHVERGVAAKDYDYLMHEAFGLLTSGKAREAFAIEKESEKTRNRYGRSQWGQCVLLGRRLIEAGVRLVHVNWVREPGDTAINNPMWDTHNQNDDRLKEVLCPQFDVGFTALVEDLEQRGLLDETLVVAIGEFGRTPKINGSGGRDHWGPVFSFAMAGAGISGGQVYGSSDKQGAYPASNRVEPPEFTATIFHLLGIGHDATFPDREGRRLHLTKGEPIYQLLGIEPATRARTIPGGDIVNAPYYDPDFIIDGDFENAAPLATTETLLPYRAWQATPLANEAQSDALCVKRVNDANAQPRAGKRNAVIGYGLGTGKGAGTIAQGARAILTQKLCSPRVGLYTTSIHVCGGGSSAEYFSEVWLKNFTCRLVMFGYNDLKKDPNNVREFASINFVPTFAANADLKAYQRFELARYLRSQDGGANETDKGVGIAIIVQKTSPGILDLSAGSGFLRIDDVDIAFNARPRDDNVQI